MKDEISGHVACTGILKCILVEKSVSKKPLGRPWHRFQDTSKLILKKQDINVLTEFMWLRTGSYQDNTVLNLCAPKKVTIYLVKKLQLLKMKHVTQS